MGKQSSRLIYQGTDIKDLYYQDGQLFQLFKLYKGNQLVWEKLGDFCLPTTALRVFDLFTNEWERGSEYTISNMTANANHAIAILIKNTKRYIAISRNLTDWKIISEIEYDSASFKGFGKKDSGFYIYNRNEIYSIDIELGLNYQISTIIDISEYKIVSYGIANGISEYAYVAYFGKNGHDVHLLQISQNGTIKDGKLGYPFSGFGSTDVLYPYIMVVGDENIFIRTEYEAISGDEIIIYKIKNMDTDILYTVYRKKAKVSNIDIIYDNYQTALFIHDANWKQLAYYRIDTMGNFLKISEKTDDSVKQITLPLYGAEGYGLTDVMGHPQISNELTVKFEVAKTAMATYEYIAEGIYPYANLVFYTASHSSNESLYINNGAYTKDCIICTTKTFNTIYQNNYAKQAQKRILIFLDNLFWEESENNYAILIDA